MARRKSPVPHRNDAQVVARHSFKATGTQSLAERTLRPRRAGTRGPRMIPTRFVKFVAAILLLPVCWVAGKTFFEEFSRAGLRHHFWSADEFYFFALGVLCWLITFFGLPRPLMLYVFGHELTHALWVWIQGGEVSAFKVGRTGGYIIADRRDFLVSLAPYFFPLYSIAVILVYGGISLYYPNAWHYRRWLFAAIGVTWGFHVSFTLWMIPKQQTDLLLHGTFFSLVVIYLANVAVLTTLLIVACPQVTWADFGVRFVDNCADVFYWAWDLTGQPHPKIPGWHPRFPVP